MAAQETATTTSADSCSSSRRRSRRRRRHEKEMTSSSTPRGRNSTFEHLLTYTKPIDTTHLPVYISANEDESCAFCSSDELDSFSRRVAAESQTRAKQASRTRLLSTETQPEIYLRIKNLIRRRKGRGRRRGGGNTCNIITTLVAILCALLFFIPNESLCNPMPAGGLISGLPIDCKPGQQVKISDHINSADPIVDRCYSCSCPNGSIECRRIDESLQCSLGATARSFPRARFPIAKPYKGAVSQQPKALSQSTGVGSGGSSGKTAASTGSHRKAKAPQTPIAQPISGGGGSRQKPRPAKLHTDAENSPTPTPQLPQSQQVRNRKLDHLLEAPRVPLGDPLHEDIAERALGFKPDQYKSKRLRYLEQLRTSSTVLESTTTQQLPTTTLPPFTIEPETVEDELATTELPSIPLEEESSVTTTTTQPTEPTTTWPDGNDLLSQTSTEFSPVDLDRPPANSQPGDRTGGDQSTINPNNVDTFTSKATGKPIVPLTGNDLSLDQTLNGPPPTNETFERLSGDVMLYIAMAVEAAILMIIAALMILFYYFRGPFSEAARQHNHHHHHNSSSSSSTDEESLGEQMSRSPSLNKAQIVDCMALQSA